MVTTIEEIAATSFADTGLVGGTHYRYQVTVRTTRGEAVASAESEAAVMHGLIDSWSLDLDEDGTVRLQVENGEVRALVSTRRSVVLHALEEGGSLAEEQILREEVSRNDIYEPRSVDTALLPNGTRALSLATNTHNQQPNRAWVMLFGADGRPISNTTRQFDFDIVAAANGQIEASDLAAAVEFDLVVHDADNRVAIADFELADAESYSAADPDAPSWWAAFAKDLVVGVDGWAFNGHTKYVKRFPGFDQEMSCLFVGGGQCAFALLDSERMFTETYENNSWLKEGDGVRSRLRLADPNPFIEIYWSTGGDGFGIEFPVSIVHGAVYRLGLRLSADEAVTWLRDPVLWSSSEEPEFPWTSVAPLGDDLLVVHGDQPERVRRDQASVPGVRLEVSHTQLRRWLDGEGREWYAVVLPDLNQIRTRAAARVV